MTYTLNFASVMIMLLGITFLLIQLHKRMLDHEKSMSQIAQALKMLADHSKELTLAARENGSNHEMELKKLQAQIQKQERLG